MTLTPAFPLGTAYLPGEAVVLRVFEARYVRLLSDVEAADRTFVSVLIEAGSEVGGGEKRFSTGVTVVIDNVAASDTGFLVHAHAQDVVDVVEWDDDLDYARARVVVRPEPTVVDDSHRDALAKVAARIDRLIERSVSLGVAGGDLVHVTAFLRSDFSATAAEDLSPMFWRCASLIPCTPLDRYELLRETDLRSRADRACAIVDHVEDLLTFRYG